MGFGGISPWSLLLILAIVLLLFGTKRLRNIGSDLGGAIKSFKKSVKEGESETEQGKVENQDTQGRVIDAEVKKEDKDKA
jgi:sec-independent protein translocase protein TatA